MENPTSQGIDGIPIEFHTAFFNYIEDDLLQLYNNILHNEKQTPKTMKQAISMLLPKKGDLNKLKHWRLISVICLDYKILEPSSRTRKFLVSFYESSYKSSQEACETDIHTYEKRS